tara:strand:- start:39019 stop:39273 length:255 start_codon:yes stop_codon:yes gene_type:complete
VAEIKFSDEEKLAIGQRVQRYVDEELDLEIGQFDAEFLLDFFAKEIGGYFYNRGLYDAQAVLEKNIEEIGESILQLEKATQLKR